MVVEPLHGALLVSVVAKKRMPDGHPGARPEFDNTELSFQLFLFVETWCGG
jgi:hypothetical protein